MSIKKKAVGICPKCGKPIFSFTIGGKGYTAPCSCLTKEREKAQEKKEKEERKERIKDALKAFYRSVGSIYEGKSFANFDKNCNPVQYSFATYFARSFRAFLNSGKGALLLGHCGTGKTHLEVAIGKEVIEKGFSVNFYRAGELYSTYCKYLSWRQQGTPLDYIRSVCDCDLLIVDDLGTDTAGGDMYRDFLYSLIDTRYSMKKPMLVSSNLQPTELIHMLGERSYDRLFSMSPVIKSSSSSQRKK